MPNRGTLAQLAQQMAESFQRLSLRAATPLRRFGFCQTINGGTAPNNCREALNDF
jgi:hypothetical protein